MKTALIIGATGLVGRNLVELLLEDSQYQRVKVFARRSLGISNPRLEEHIVNFDEISCWKQHLTGDDLFSAMGTTLKDAGSKDAQYKIDYTYQFEVAKACAENQVSNLYLVSSAGADSKSKIFYSRIKGELENSIQELDFKKVVIFRPSVLVGVRERPRVMEQIGGKIGKVLCKIVPGLGKYQPIDGSKVAQAMINAAKITGESKVLFYSFNEIHQLGER